MANLSPAAIDSNKVASSLCRVAAAVAVPGKFSSSQAVSMTLSLRSPRGVARCRLISAARMVKNFLTRRRGKSA
jgi:hypothetical protein